MKAVLLISHGSRSLKTLDEVKKLVSHLKKKSEIKIFEYAFLELEHPSIPEGIDICVKKGASDVIVLLNFLNSGRHVDVDIPAIVEESRRKYPKVKIKITSPVGRHKQTPDLFLSMIH